MRLCESAGLLLLLLVALTRAAPGSEQCSKLDIVDKTQILGRSHMMAVFSDNDLVRTVFGLISSLWSSITQTQTGFRLANFYRINGTCVGSRFDMTISGDTIKGLMLGLMTEGKFLIFSETSMIMDIRATADSFTTMIQKLHLDLNMDVSPSEASQGVKAHNLYLLSREPELNEMDLQRFRAHAQCEGFTGEPVVLRKSSQAYCTEEESATIQ